MARGQPVPKQRLGAAAVGGALAEQRLDMPVSGWQFSNVPIFFAPKAYENPLTAQGRARTIAAFHLAQGDAPTLTNSDMRRDVLRALMSESAVGYWLNEKGWLEFVRKVGKIQILRLTDDGLRTCANSVAGGSNVPTTPELVAIKRRHMLEGGPGHMRKEFPELPE